MTDERYSELEKNYELRLTPSELAEGWHWCYEYDGMLVGPGMQEMQNCLCTKGMYEKRW